MATLMSVLLTLLGNDLEDDWTGTSTAIGNAGGTTIVDDLLHEKVPDWVVDGMVIYFPDGPSGAGSAETKVVDSLNTNTLTLKTAASAQIASGVSYEIHRLFTRSQKLTALRNGADLICPGIHAVVRDMSFETIEHQYEYDISSLSLYNNRPHQLLFAQHTIRDIWEASTAYIVGDYVRPASLSTFTGLTYKCTTAGTSHGSTEPTWPTTVDDTVDDNGVIWEAQEDLDHSSYPMVPLHDWDVTPDGKLFLNAAFDPGYKLMIVGIKPLEFTSSGATETIALNKPFTYVLSAQAAKYLFEQRMGSANGQDIEQITHMMQTWATRLAMRKAQFWMKPPDGTLLSGPGLTV